MNITRFTAAVVILAAFTAAGCGPSPAFSRPEVSDTCRAPGFAVPYEDIDPCSAEAVLQAAVAAIFDYRPAVDSGPRAAFTRARRLVQDGFARGAEPAAGAWAPITTGQWQRWRHQQVPIITTAMVTGDDHPADTSGSVDRVLAVRVQPADGAVVEFTVYAGVTRTASGPWLLSGLGVRS